MATDIVKVFLECLSSVGEGDIASLVSERNRKISRSISVVQGLFDRDDSRKNVEAIASKITEDLKSVITEAGCVVGCSDKLWHLFHQYRSEKLVNIGMRWEIWRVWKSTRLLSSVQQKSFFYDFSANSNRQKSVSPSKRVKSCYVCRWLCHQKSKAAR